MKSLFATFQFMTRIPVPESWTKDFDFNRFVEGIIWFPLVGVVVGAFASAAFISRTNFLIVRLQRLVMCWRWH